ncbi:hypothetical protein ACTID9_01055 [Brevibacillus fluminis]|uniref:hypothetical protein n=1 Tax=Brevibacillus fluminis TaxID=511487 RepID=UPI003F8C9669
MSQTSKKGDVEFIIAGDDNVTQIFKGIISELQHVRNQTQQTGRDVNHSLDDMSTSSRRASDGVETIGDRLERLGQETATLKKLNNELHQTEDSARDAGREMERGFRDGGQAAERAESKVKALKSRVTEVAREMRNMFSAINEGTMGFQTFVGDQIKRGVVVGGAATIGFAASSLHKQVNQEYEFAKLGSVVKSGYMDAKGVLDEKRYNAEFAALKEYIRQQGLRSDRETDIMGAIGISSELAKNNMGPQQIKAALPVVSDFAQASGLAPDVASKYLANKLEAAKMAYTPENFAKVADQFMKTVDMSSLDPQDLLYAEKYTDFGNAIGNVDYAISQAMQVLLSKISVEGETGGTALRTLFLESSNMSISDSARSNVSSEKVGRAIDAIISQVNKVNAAVDADKSVAADQKGNEKILRKAAIMNKYMNQLTADQQLEVGATLFGKEAASVTTIFANDGYQNLLETIDAIRGSSGITKRYADDRANTSKGQLVALGKEVDEIQNKVGRSLEPLLAATTKQMTNLATEGKFSFEEIQKGVDESADSLAKELNPEIASVFKQLSDLTVNGFQIGVALTPLAEGTGKAIMKLLNGDLSGAAHEIVLAIDATDLKIENLPGELEGLATAAKNAAIFLAAMIAVDKGIKLAENGKKIWDAGQKVGEKLRGNEGKNTPSTLGDERNIRANVVNVYGSKVNGSGSGNTTPVPANSGKGSEDQQKPKGDQENKNEQPEKKKKGWFDKGSGESKVDTNLEKWGSRGLMAYSLADMFGATDYMPNFLNEYLSGLGIGAFLNQFLGNPLKGGKGPAAIGYFWYKGLDAYGQYTNEQTSKHFQEDYNPTGIDKWVYRKFKPADKSVATFPDYYYMEDRAHVMDFLMSKKGDPKVLSYLPGFSDSLIDEAKRNSAGSKPHLFSGYDEKNIDAYFEKRLQQYISQANTNYTSPARTRKTKEEMQYGRLMDTDSQVEPYKDKMTAMILEKPTASTAMTSLLQQFSPILGTLAQVLQQPVKVESQSNNTITIFNKTPLEIGAEFSESITSYANRTHNQRTLTPMQAVKMRQLE